MPIDAEMLSLLCSRGECPINMDSFSQCPVMALASKPCSEIRLEDWIHWTEETKRPDSLYRMRLIPDLEDQA